MLYRSYDAKAVRARLSRRVHVKYLFKRHQITQVSKQGKAPLSKRENRFQSGRKIRFLQTHPGELKAALKHLQAQQAACRKLWSCKQRETLSAPPFPSLPSPIIVIMIILLDLNLCACPVPLFPTPR